MSRPKLWALLSPISVLLIGSVRGDSSYSAQKDDCLSIIAERMLGKPVYGETGSLNRILAANPEIRNPSYLLPGTVIRIPKVERIPSVEAPPASDLLPLPLPTPEIEPSPMPAQEVGNYIGVGAHFRSLSLHATDPLTRARATLVSRRGPGGELFIGQRYSEKLRSEFRVGIEQIAFDAPDSRAVQNLSTTLFRISAEIEYRVAERWRISAGLPIVQDLFISAVQTTANYTLKRITTVAPTFTADYSFARSSKLEPSIGIETRVLVPSSTDALSTELGFGAGPRIRVGQKFGAHDGETVFSYSLNRQKTNLTMQNTPAFTLSFRFLFNYGGDENHE
jgi:hypothetical protein